MFENLYNYFNPDDLNYAINQICFYENKIRNIQQEDINDSNKLLKIKRITFIINAIKYKYNL